MAVKVTTKIKEILKARDAEILDGTRAVLALLEEVRKQILAELAQVPAESYSAYYQKQALASIDQHLASWESATARELSGRLATTWEAGAGLLPAAAEAAGMSLRAPWISSHLLDSLKEFTFGRISSVRGDLYNKIRGELTLGMLGQKTPFEVAQEIAGGIGGLPLPVGKGGVPIFKSVAERAEVITGTEMGRAFSLATEKSIEAAQETLPELQRMWLHAGHPRVPRQTHLLMHGQVRKVGKPFYQTPEGAKVHYPRDPRAPIKEVIRCGCTHVPYMKEWGDAKEFAADFDAQQVKANQKRS